MTTTIDTQVFYEYAKAEGLDPDQVMGTIGQIISKYPELIEHDDEGRTVADLDKLIHVAKTERAIIEQEESGIDEETFLRNMVKGQIETLKAHGYKPLQVYKELREHAKQTSAQAVVHAEAQIKDHDKAVDVVAEGAQQYLATLRECIKEVFEVKFKTKRKKRK